MITGTPRGFRDILPHEALVREGIVAKVRECFSSAGYLPVETPLLEDRRVLERAGRIQDSPFQLFDSDDRLLMLRPDLTLPIARMVSTRMADDEMPLRLRYEAPVFREQASLRGRPRQFTQLGIELIGGDDVASECEVVSLLAWTLEALGVASWHIVCGSVSPLTALLDHCVADGSLRETILSLVHSSDLVGLDEAVGTSDMDVATSAALRRIVRLHGGAEALDEVDDLLSKAGVDEARRGVGELRMLSEGLDRVGLSGRLTFDFSIVNSFDYYTGVVFKAYADGMSSSLASGGRYDAVLANLGMPGVAACGFALSLERLQEALGESDVRGEGRGPLRIAVPKGSLNADTISALKAAGLPVEGLANPGRKLIISAGDVEYVIVRATDAPAFVSHGGADCGICGSDSLIEADLDLIQLVDLGYGACRFIVAEPASHAGWADRAYARRGTMRVATKYPRITQAYYDDIGQQVDILALHGNIELGPIVGMVDRIVDITATGTTLAENDLVIVDDVMECTARFFANPAAYRCDERICDLATRLSSLS